MLRREAQRRGRVTGEDQDRVRQIEAQRVAIAGGFEEENNDLLCVSCGVAIGECGCGGRASTVIESMAGLPQTQRSNGGSGVPLPEDNGDWPNNWLCRAGCFPADATPFGMRRAMRSLRGRRMPYLDPRMDAIDMDQLVSAVTTVTAGTTTNVELTPANGTFLAFYWSIVAVASDTQVQSVDWRAGTPRIEGCPLPCQQPDEPQLSQFVMKVPEGCCGQTGVFWLDKRSEDSPLITPFTNNQGAGDLLVQLKVYGFCCSQKIC